MIAFESLVKTDHTVFNQPQIKTELRVWFINPCLLMLAKDNADSKYVKVPIQIVTREK